MSTDYLQQQTRKILSKEQIGKSEFRNAINLVFLDEIPDCTIASFLTALTYRGVQL
jgi:anthranilate phosphoribosyltransferase